MIGRQDTAEPFEEGRFAGAVGSDEAEHFARPDRKGHVAESGQVAVTLREVDDLQHQPTKLLGCGGYYQRP